MRCAFESASSLSGARESLPSYMVPSLVVGVDAWPRTSSGKIDRKRLPRRRGRARRRVGIAAPSTAAEAAAREAFAATLRLAAEAVSVEAGFFELGGNSLRAVALARALSAALGREVRAADVMARPTARGLARWPTATRTARCALPPLERTVDGSRLEAGAHPVSWNQSQLLTVHVVDGATAAYNIPSATWLGGGVDVGALRRALVCVVDRHAVLRTTYEVGDDGGFAQRVRPTPSVAALLVEAVASDEASAGSLASSEASCGFELLGEAARVLRCTLVRVGVGAGRSVGCCC